MNTCRKHRTLSQTCRSISQEDIIEAFKVEKGSIELDTSYAYELFILACSVLVLLLNLFANLHGRLTPQEVAVLDISDNAMCLVFFVDFVRNYGLNRKKRALARKHLWNTPLDKFKLAVFYTADLLSCIPSDLPLGGRFLRIFRVLKIYRLLRAAKNAKVLMFCLIKDSAIGALLGATFLSLTTVIFGALLVLRFELAAGPEALINTAERALWWSFVSISNASTMGYSHLQPITTGGKFVGACLIVVGAGLFSTLCGTIASWMLVIGSQKPQEEDSEILVSKLTSITDELRELKSEVLTLKQEMRNKNLQA
eukprot:jgi/Pico_ML_1/55075/g825.t1